MLMNNVISPGFFFKPIKYLHFYFGTGLFFQKYFPWNAVLQIQYYKLRVDKGRKIKSYSLFQISCKEVIFKCSCMTLFPNLCCFCAVVATAQTLWTARPL